jgi:hypothetical protein
MPPRHHTSQRQSHHTFDAPSQRCKRIAAPRLLIHFSTFDCFFKDFRPDASQVACVPSAACESRRSSSGGQVRGRKKQGSERGEQRPGRERGARAHAAPSRRRNHWKAKSRVQSLGIILTSGTHLNLIELRKYLLGVVSIGTRFDRFEFWCEDRIVPRPRGPHGWGSRGRRLARGGG